MKWQERAVVFGCWHLGPLARKVGQVLSMRTDLLSFEACKALEPLREDSDQKLLRGPIVPPATIPDGVTLVSDRPIGAGTIGLVYKCRYKKHNAVVKVVRPDVVWKMKVSMLVVQLVLQAIEILQQWIDLRAYVGMSVTWDSFRPFYEDHTDLVKEAETQIKVWKLVRKLGLTKVDVPQVLYYSPECLVMKYVPKARTRWSRDQQLDVGIEHVLMQWHIRRRLGFLHADLHPGNLKHSLDGKLYWLDFGSCVHLDQASNRILDQAIEATFRTDAKEMVKLMVKYDLQGTSPTPADLAKMEQIVHKVMHTDRMTAGVVMRSLFPYLRSRGMWMQNERAAAFLTQAVAEGSLPVLFPYAREVDIYTGVLSRLV